MYNMHIFYLAPLMFSRSSHFLISSLHAGNTKIKGQPHWAVLLNICQLFSFMHDYYFLPCMWPKVIDLFPSKLTGILWRTSTCLPSRAAWFRCMIIVSFHACGLRWSICFLQSRRTNQNKCRTKKYPRFVLFSCRRYKILHIHPYKDTLK